jgi:predicted MPP superfamily phosphohydrolase
MTVFGPLLGVLARKRRVAAGIVLNVSRGVGTAILNVRFWCRPEIAMITVGS